MQHLRRSGGVRSLRVVVWNVRRRIIVVAHHGVFGDPDGIRILGVHGLDVCFKRGCSALNLKNVRIVVQSDEVEGKVLLFYLSHERIKPVGTIELRLGRRWRTNLQPRSLELRINVNGRLHIDVARVGFVETEYVAVIGPGGLYAVPARLGILVRGPDHGHKFN